MNFSLCIFSLIALPARKMNLYLVRYHVRTIFEHRPSFKVVRISAEEEILRLVCKPKFNYRVDKNSPLDPVVTHLNLAHILILFKIHFSDHLNLCYQTRLLPSGFATKILY